jgi:hypothetical protein
MGALGERMIEWRDGEGQLDWFPDGAEFAAESGRGDIARPDGTFLAQAFHGSAAEDGSGAGCFRPGIELAETGFEPDQLSVGINAGVEEVSGAEEDRRAVVPGEARTTAEGSGDGSFEVVGGSEHGFAREGSIPWVVHGEAVSVRQGFSGDP